MAGLSARYASALFELALESGNAAAYRDQAVLIRDALSDEACRRVIEHPHVSAQQKKELVSRAFAGKISEDLLGFLHLAIDKNRERFILPGLRALIGRLDEHFGRAGATIVSASALSEEQIAALRELIGKKLGKELEISVQIDPSLIGGFYIYADGYLLDRTIKTRLKEMKVSLQRSTAHDS